MTLQELQNQTDQWIKEHGVRYFNELTNLAILMEEVGEFSRVVARTYGEQSFKDPHDATLAKEKMSDEAADILFVLTCLCNQMDIDLTTAMKSNFDKKTIRDQHRHHQNPKLS